MCALRGNVSQKFVANLFVANGLLCVEIVSYGARARKVVDNQLGIGVYKLN